MAKPLLHLVFGGEVKDPGGVEFVDTDNLDIVGIYPNYDTAFKAWRGASQQHVDQAHIKYVIVHLHRLMDPEKEEPAQGHFVPDRDPLPMGASTWPKISKVSPKLAKMTQQKRSKIARCRDQPSMPTKHLVGMRYTHGSPLSGLTTRSRSWMTGFARTKPKATSRGCAALKSARTIISARNTCTPMPTKWLGVRITGEWQAGHNILC